MSTNAKEESDLTIDMGEIGENSEYEEDPTSPVPCSRTALGGIVQSTNDYLMSQNNNEMDVTSSVPTNTANPNTDIVTPTPINSKPNDGSVGSNNMRRTTSHDNDVNMLNLGDIRIDDTNEEKETSETVESQ